MLSVRWPHKPPMGWPLNRGHPLTRGLVGCWLFNEGGGNRIYDLSGYNNTGTLTNMAFPPTTASGWNPGERGPTLVFDGSNDYGFVRIPSWTQLTIVARCNLLAAGSYPEIVSSGGVQHILRFYEDTRRPDVVWNYDNAGWARVLSPDAVALNTWHQLACTFDGTELTLYVDAQNKGTATPTYTAKTGWGIGARCGEDGNVDPLFPRYTNTIIDHVIFWCRALTSQELSRLYCEPFCMFDWDLPLAVAAPPPGIVWPIFADEIHSAVFGGQVVR